VTLAARLHASAALIPSSAPPRADGLRVHAVVALPLPTGGLHRLRRRDRHLLRGLHLRGDAGPPAVVPGPQHHAPDAADHRDAGSRRAAGGLCGGRWCDCGRDGRGGDLFSSSGAIDVSAAVIDETQLAWLKGLPSYKHVVAMARAAAARRARDGRPYRPLDFSRRWPNTSPEGRDLLARMLCFDPSKRITAAVALAHPYLSDYACPEDEPVAQPPDLAEWQVREPGTMAARRRDGVLGRLNASREWDSFDLGHWHHLSPSLLAPSLPPRSSSLTTAGPPSPSWRRRWRRRWRTSRCRRRPWLQAAPARPRRRQRRERARRRRRRAAVDRAARLAAAVAQSRDGRRRWKGRLLQRATQADCCHHRHAAVRTMDHRLRWCCSGCILRRWLGHNHRRRRHRNLRRRPRRHCRLRLLLHRPPL
jgi:hypothetical protein